MVQTVNEDIGADGPHGPLLQTVEAVHYCHERGVIHRDLKLTNVYRTADESWVLGDFGSALLDAETVTFSTRRFAVFAPFALAFATADAISFAIGAAARAFAVLAVVLADLLLAELGHHEGEACELCVRVEREERSPSRKRPEERGRARARFASGTCTLPSEPQLSSSPYALWENCTPHTSAPCALTVRSGAIAAAGALVLLLAAAGAFFFYRRNTAAKKSQDVEANANGVCDEADGLEAPPQTAAITSKVNEPPPPPAPGLLARALSRRGSDAAAAAPPPAPAAAPTTTVRGNKKRGPVKGARAKADSKIRMVFAPMAAWYHDPARGALRQRRMFRNRTWYYLAIAADFVLRFGWTATLVPGTQPIPGLPYLDNSYWWVQPVVAVAKELAEREHLGAERAVDVVLQ